MARQGTKRIHSHHQTWNSSLPQQTKVTEMYVASNKEERRCDEPQYAGKHKCRPHCFTRRETGNQQQGRHRETSAANSGKPHGQRDCKSEKSMCHCDRSEKV